MNRRGSWNGREHLTFKPPLNTHSSFNGRGTHAALLPTPTVSLLKELRFDLNEAMASYDEKRAMMIRKEREEGQRGRRPAALYLDCTLAVQSLDSVQPAATPDSGTSVARSRLHFLAAPRVPRLQVKAQYRAPPHVHVRAPLHVLALARAPLVRANVHAPQGRPPRAPHVRPLVRAPR
eukprot:990218-Rhodomonas_salina.1